jgi:flagellar motor switch protein FliM
VEQLSFLDFAHSLPSRTSLAVLAMKPYDGTAVLELNPALVFPLLEALLGGTVKGPVSFHRETTEIEQSILDGLLREILDDLENAWLPVAPMKFAIEGHETEPHLLQILPRNEAVVAIRIEVGIGGTSGMMNLCIPCIVVKRLRQTFDQPCIPRKARAPGDEYDRVLRLIQPAGIHLDARLQGPTLRLQALLDLQQGDVLALDYPLARPVNLIVNGKLKYVGKVIASGARRALEIQRLV